MAQVPARSLAAAARTLMLAGRWTDALALLDTARPDEAERSLLAVTAADVAVEQDFFSFTNVADRYLEAASGCVGDADAWDLDFVRLKRAISEEQMNGPASWDPADRDPVVVSGLAARAVALRDSAPDDARRGRASFYGGIIHDLLRGDPAAGRAMYEAAREWAAAAGDELIVSYALRHLGYLAMQAGDLNAARADLVRSLELRMRLGCVPQVLAQYLALAELAQLTGDSGWAHAVAELVRDWANAGAGTRWLGPSAAELLK